MFSFKLKARVCQYHLALPGNVCSGDQDLLSSQQTGDHSPDVPLVGSFMDSPRAQLSLTQGAAQLCDPGLVFAEKTAAAL